MTTTDPTVSLHAVAEAMCTELEEATAGHVACDCPACNALCHAAEVEYWLRPDEEGEEDPRPEYELGGES